jgi:hypothetical protein
LSRARVAKNRRYRAAKASKASAILSTNDTEIARHKYRDMTSRCLHRAASLPYVLS